MTPNGILTVSALQGTKNSMHDNDEKEMDASVFDQSPEERAAAEDNFNRYYYVRGRGHLDYILEANNFDRFYRGEQWSDQDKSDLAKEGRPAMTVNLILAAINSVKGEYSNKRADFKFKPKRDGASTDQAMILNKVIMHESDDTGYDDHEADMFLDGLITDRGYLDIRMSDEDNVAGEIEVTLRDPRSVIPDPDASSYDPKLWADVITSQFLSLDEIKVKYGEKKEAIVRTMIDVGGYFKQDSVEFYEETTFGDDIGFSVGSNDGGFYGSSEDGEKGRVKSVRVVDRQYWKVGTFKYFVNPKFGDRIEVPINWDEARVAEHALKFGLSVETKQERRVRWTISADKTLLFDEWSPYSSFTIIPFFPYFRRGHPIGMVRNLINAQEILNKTTSQMLHVVNTTANSGWIVEKGSLSNMTADDLANKGSKTGIVIEKNPGRESPEKIKPNSVPTGIDAVGSRATDSIFEISGVNRAMLGQDSASISGIALENRQSRGLLQLQPVFDNLARSRRMVGAKFLELIQRFYTDERVFMISDYKQENSEPEEIRVNEKFREGEEVSIVNDLTMGKYSVAIGSMPARDVYSEEQFAEIVGLREAGIPIPDHRVVQYSNLDNKEELSEELKRMAGLAAPTEQEAQLQQLEMEVQLQMVQMSVEAQAADIDLKQSQARLAEAKAMESSDKPMLEREKLELEASITAIEQATRERVNRTKELSQQVKEMQKQRASLEETRTKILGDLTKQGMANKQATTAEPRKTEQ